MNNYTRIGVTIFLEATSKSKSIEHFSRCTFVIYKRGVKKRLEQSKPPYLPIPPSWIFMGGAQEFLEFCNVPTYLQGKELTNEILYLID